MFGPGYILSWDLVQYLNDNRASLKQYLVQWEDKAISDMIKWGKDPKECWTEFDGTEYHDYYDSQGWYPAKVTNKTILVHLLKDAYKLADAMNSFLGE